jgi:glycyl-tRNA synthetase alpha chain
MPLAYQDLLFELQKYWSAQGCVIQQPYDLEVGAGTMCPETFLRVLGPDPYRVAYVQPSRRPNDGRYGENPNRLYKHMQLQVILKPAPADVQDLYLNSLEHIGISLDKHDIKFEEDNWEAPTLGAWGVGWQVMLDGLEISQFTYFQQCGGIDLDPVPVELTYGLERLCAFIQDVDSVYDIQWNPAVAGAKTYTYRDIRWRDERDFSVYNFEQADVPSLWKEFELYEAEAKRLIALVDPPLLAAHEQVLKCSHLFNLLDARGAISVTERVGMIARVRDLAVGVAGKWVAPPEEIQA